MPPRTIINPSHRSIDKALMHRIDTTVVAMTDAEQIAYLSEAVYQERRRFHQDETNHPIRRLVPDWF